jgi:hypothetical protein
MVNNMSRPARLIEPGMTLLEVVYRHRRTQEVFRGYDQQAGVCLLCEALFDTLEEAAAKYRLDLENLLAELETAAAGPH